MHTGFEVIEDIAVKLNNGASYTLLPGDLLVEDYSGKYTKVCPGIALGGLEVAASELESKARSVSYKVNGLVYKIV